MKADGSGEKKVKIRHRQERSVQMQTPCPVALMELFLRYNWLNMRSR